jgi:hypothetical protein
LKTFYRANLRIGEDGIQTGTFLVPSSMYFPGPPLLGLPTLTGPMTLIQWAQTSHGGAMLSSILAELAGGRDAGG